MSEPNRDLLPFSLEDAKGNAHPYETILLPAREGLPLSLSLMKALGEPLLALLDGAGDTAEGEDASFDLNALGPTLVNLDPTLLSTLAESVLSNTMRDGKRLKGIEFDKAYRGNYMELYKAVWEVVRLNRLIPLPDTSLATGAATP